jgi:hypothetical protein
MACSTLSIVIPCLKIWGNYTFLALNLGFCAGLA